jgi:uncharacterized protein (DUF58 family)
MKTPFAGHMRLEAHDLAARMPPLLVEAKRVAHTVAYGIHGRRRPGPGDTFWQFRHFEASDAAPMIDWRRSASSHRYYVRQREWEAAHTVWLWLDLSPSMAFQSSLAPVSKMERAMVLALAAAELLVQNGERVGIPGLVAPTVHRGAAEKLAEAWVRSLAAGQPSSLPPRALLGRHTACVFVSDFLEPAATLHTALEDYAAQGIRGHLTQVLDPAEETLPYHGRVEFIASEGPLRVLTDRAETVREQYQRKLEAHRDELRSMTRRFQWLYTLHHSSRPASEALLALYAGLSGLNRPGQADYRAQAAGERGTP